MEENKKTAAEAAFQERFVQELKGYGWKAPDVLNGNKQDVFVEDLEDHWRQELNRINADQLEGVALTDNEFKQVMAKVKGIDNSFEAAKILAMEGSTGKIDGIHRDPQEKVTREQITLTIFKKSEVTGGDSSYKVAREVRSPRGNRFDVVLLINGLPMINIEQKRTDKSLDEAFGQFKRYYRDGEYINNFMAFSQMMVIMSEVATRYFATPKSIHDFNKSFVFQWADPDNRPINDWQEVVKHFLMIPMAHQLVGDYLIIDEAADLENKKHMIMRPYQVYALQAVERAALGWGPDGIRHGGYVWHTTGSGKTITSFKTALFLSTRGGFDKVVFLVDRRSLDSATSEKFKAYAAYESVSVDDTKHTYHLRKQLLSKQRGIIVTTTFKLDSLVKDLKENGDNRLAEKKIVFIIDEAHRTTMGKMMVNIKSYFKKTGLFYGFTGTPLFDENKAEGMINKKSEVIDTTEKLFGPELHKYTIDQAIRDGNVLGFHVDYMNTGEFESYSQLREDLAEKMLEEKPEVGIKNIERELLQMEKADLERAARKKELLVYQDESHIPRVVAEILENWESQSQGRFYNAILTVAYKDRVVAYYNEFKKALSDRENPINIAMTFSLGNENDPEATPPDLVKEMYKDYGEFTGIEFRPEDNDAYFGDLVARSSRGGSGRNPKNIDLIIVADQLLTGYDSRYLNTLYVDRFLKLQGLIQAYSRTNRVQGPNKEFGTVINYLYPAITEKDVDTALKLYGSGGHSSSAIVEHYDEAVRKFSVSVEELQGILEDPTAWADLKENEERKEAFLESFSQANQELNTVQQYYEYEWKDDEFGINEHRWMKYIGAYKNLKPEAEEGETRTAHPLVGRSKLSGTEVINADYILNLIGEQISRHGEVQTVDSETLRIIYQQIQELSDLGEDDQAKLLREFVDTELIKGNLSSATTFDELFEEWKEEKANEDIQEFAKDWGIDGDILKESLKQYSLQRKKEIPYIDDLQKSLNYEEARDPKATPLEHSMNLISDALPEYMIEIKKKYE
ncbi:MAG: HsdR family type I site-specific deoxyribonuclease [Atopostipes suicloacalis]|nr:HsdR family type I site-specific deoxyribonuclease [Atopostipes suicloacalis]